MPKVPPRDRISEPRPREQLGSFKLVPGLENMKISGKWLHPDSFKDEYLSERMRLQLWTLRIE